MPSDCDWLNDTLVKYGFNSAHFAVHHPAQLSQEVQLVMKGRKWDDLCGAVALFMHNYLRKGGDSKDSMGYIRLAAISFNIFANGAGEHYAAYGFILLGAAIDSVRIDSSQRMVVSEYLEQLSESIPNATECCEMISEIAGVLRW
jgi:hypothetical protein